MARISPGPGFGLSRSLNSVTSQLIKCQIPSSNSPTLGTERDEGAKYLMGGGNLYLRRCSDKSVHSVQSHQLTHTCNSETLKSGSSNSSSNGFIRLKFNEDQTICGVPCRELECVVNVKGKENGVSVISRAAQVRQFGEFVDTHVVSGRCLEIFVRNKKTGAIIGGAVNITQHTLANKCLSAPRKKKEFPLILDKGGELLVTVKYFTEKEEKCSSVARKLAKGSPATSSLSHPNHVESSSPLSPQSHNHRVVNAQSQDQFSAHGSNSMLWPSGANVGGGGGNDDSNSINGGGNNSPTPTSKVDRRCAVKEKKIHAVNGHHFVSHFFSHLTFCSFCSDLLWGLLSNQGYRCTQCTLVVHKKCHLKVLSVCPGSLRATPIAQELVERFNIDMPHQFVVESSVSVLKLPVFCEHCGQMLVPLYHCALKCAQCGFLCHKKCSSFVANICGVNQKSMAQALHSINALKQGELDRALKGVSNGVSGCDHSRQSGISESEGRGDGSSQSSYLSDMNANYVGLYSPFYPPSHMHPGQVYPHQMSSSHQSSTLNDTCGGSDNTSYVPIMPPRSPSKLAQAGSPGVTERKNSGSVYEHMWMSTSGSPIFCNPLYNSKSNCGKVTVNDFKLRTLIGRGSFGKVVLAEHVTSGVPVALKVLSKRSVLMEDDTEAVFVERDVLQLTSFHPFFTHLIASFHTKRHLCLVMEFVQGGDMMFHMAKHRRLVEPIAAFVSGEVILALKFLHQHNVIYRDLKLDNVLIDGEGHVRLTDFGMCKRLKHSEDFASTLCGTPDYMAPEIMFGGNSLVGGGCVKYTFSVDWWALGVLLFEMVCGSTPFRCPVIGGANREEERDKARQQMILSGSVSHYPHHLSQNCKSAIKEFLTVDIQQRLGCSNTRDPVKHPFFAQLDFDRLERKLITPPHNFHVTNRSKKRSREDRFDSSNFEDQFTRERVSLSDEEDEEDDLDEEHQKLFRNFSFVAPTAPPSPSRKEL